MAFAVGWGAPDEDGTKPPTTTHAAPCEATGSSILEAVCREDNEGDAGNLDGLVEQHSKLFTAGSDFKLHPHQARAIEFGIETGQTPLSKYFWHSFQDARQFAAAT